MIKNHFFRFSFLICLFIIFIQHLYANNVSDNNIKLLEKALVTDDYTTIIQRLKEINSNQETRTFLDILSSDERLSKQARLMARIHLGNTYYKMNKPNDALLIAQDIYNNSEIKTNAIKQRLNLLLSDTYEDLSKYDSSLYYLEQIIEHKPLATLNLTHGDLYNRKANLFNRLNQFNQAISFYQKALTDHLLNKDSVGIANSYHGFAYAYRKKGMVDSSAFYEYRSLKISENAKYEHGIKLAYQSLAILSYYQKNYKKSIEEAKQLCDLLVKPSDKSTLANTQNLIGINYAYLKQLDSALFHHRESLKLKMEIGNTGLIGSSYNNIATAFLIMNMPDSAINYLLKTKPILEELKDTSKLATLYSSIANLHLKNEDLIRPKLSG